MWSSVVTIKVGREQRTVRNKPHRNLPTSTSVSSFIYYEGVKNEDVEEGRCFPGGKVTLDAQIISNRCAILLLGSDNGTVYLPGLAT
jgi:hypothetical protein